MVRQIGCKNAGKFEEQTIEYLWEVPHSGMEHEVVSQDKNSLSHETHESWPP